MRRVYINNRNESLGRLVGAMADNENKAGEAAEGGYMVCLRCGKLVPEASSYCTSCGNDLKADPVPGQAGSSGIEEFRRSDRVHAGAAPAAAGGAPAALAEERGFGEVRPHTPTYSGGPYPLPYAPVRPQVRTEPLAVASLVCALASFTILPFFTGIAAIVLGIMSRDRIKRSQERLEGDSFALVGLILGVINVVMVLGLVLLALAAYLSEAALFISTL